MIPPVLIQICHTLLDLHIYSVVLLLGSKRKDKEVVGGVSASSSTPIAEVISIPFDEADPSGVVGGGINSGSGSGIGSGSGNGSGSGSDTGTQSHEQSFAAAPAAGDEIDVIDVDQDGSPAAKRAKKYTSDVWMFLPRRVR